MSTTTETFEISDRTRLTITLADDIHDVDVRRVAKKLRKKFGLTVIDVLAEKVDSD